MGFFLGFLSSRININWRFPMRWLAPTLMMICCVTGYAQESSETASEAEVVEVAAPESDEVASAPAPDSLHAGKKDCPCSGGGKSKARV